MNMHRANAILIFTGLVLVASLLFVARRSSYGGLEYKFLLKDRATGQTISNAAVSFTVYRDYPLLGRLTFLSSQFGQGSKSYNAKTSDGIIRLPTGYPDPEKWFLLKAEGYEEGPFNMECILQADRNSSASNKLSALPVLYLERPPAKRK
jgi:hypothetical protein